MSIEEGKQGLWANIHAKRKRIKAGSGERMRKPGSKGAPSDADFKAASKNEAVEVKDTDDYKLSKSGRKIKAHRIIFNKGEDDGKKGVSEQMKKSFDQFVQEHAVDLTEEQLDELVAELQEVLGKGDPAGKWISDFVHSDNPKFAGKSKEKRKQMALAAYYSKMREEAFIDEEQIDELNKDTLNSYIKKAKTNYNTQTKRMSRAYGSDGDTYDDAAHKRDARKAGLKRAKSQLAVKEETEQTNEAIVPEYDDPISRMRKKENEEKRKQKEKAGMKEELKGNQHKLDKNKNGKLDKHDFKLLRKEENVEEGMSHQAKTTMKHVENPTAGEKKAARDIKPGIKGYRDRIAMLHSAAARGGLKKEEAESVEEGAKKIPASNKPIDPKDLVVPLKDVPIKKPRGYKQYDPAKEFPGVFQKEGTNIGGKPYDMKASLKGKSDKELDSLIKSLENKPVDHAAAHKLVAAARAERAGRIGKKGVAEEVEQIDEVFPGTPEYEKKFPKRVTGAGARHDIKATPTGVIATRRFADNDEAEKPENAPKRGRGRPKKDKFAEAVEFLMSLDEEMFDDLTEEGIDTFIEQFEQLDEISKATLGSYVKKASAEVEYNSGRTQRHITQTQDAKKRAKDPKLAFARKDNETLVKAHTNIANRSAAKVQKRQAGISKAVDRLTK